MAPTRDPDPDNDPQTSVHEHGRSGLQMKLRSLAEAREELDREELIAGPEPTQGTEWAQWDREHQLRVAKRLSLDLAESRLNSDPAYIIGSPSMAQGSGTFKGYDPATDIEWRVAKEPNFSHMAADVQQDGSHVSNADTVSSTTLQGQRHSSMTRIAVLTCAMALAVCLLWLAYNALG